MICILTISERFEDLFKNSGKTLDELAKDISNKTNIPISKAQLCVMANNDKKNYGYQSVLAIAKYFDVSADYLLGLTNAKTNDKDIQFICDYTGLNEKTIERLQYQCAPRNIINSNFYSLNFNGFHFLLDYTENLLSSGITDEILQTEFFYGLSHTIAILKSADNIFDKLLSNDIDLYSLRLNQLNDLKNFIEKWDREIKFEFFQTSSLLNKYFDSLYNDLYVFNNLDNITVFEDMKLKINHIINNLNGVEIDE